MWINLYYNVCECCNLASNVVVLYKTFVRVCECVWIWIYYICIVIQFICVCRLSQWQSLSIIPKASMATATAAATTAQNMYILSYYIQHWIQSVYEVAIFLCMIQCVSNCVSVYEHEHEHDKYISMFRSLVFVLTSAHSSHCGIDSFSSWWNTHTPHTNRHTLTHTWKCFWWINFIIHVRAKHIQHFASISI